MAFPNRDVDISDKTELVLASAKHIKYLEKYGETIDSYEFAIAEYLRMSGIYWTTTCLDLLSALDKSKRFQKDFVVDYVRSCQKPSGGFAPHPTHDENLPHTLCAIQVLTTFDSIASIGKEACISYVLSLQQPDGSFTGDKWGEVDTRFSLCATACLALLGALDRCDRDKAAEFIESCRNFDGGFGVSPGGESHGAMIYCCVGTLSLLGRLDIVDADKLGLWLAKRQLPSGGLNGRPEKHPDVCYSWWILASLAIIGRLHWIDAGKLQRYILACQDTELGGIADRPGNYADPFHTVFGTAGLSLLPVSLQSAPAEPDEKGDAPAVIALKKVNPVLCMAQEIIDRAPPYITYDERRKYWDGVLVDVLEAACAYLDFDCTYFKPPVANLANETIDGVMGAVTNRTADVGIAAVGISASRNQYFNMIDSFLRRPYLVVIHRTHLISIPSSEFIQHTLGEMVSDSVWFSMVSALPVLIILGMCVDAVEMIKEGRVVRWRRLCMKWTFQIFGMGLGLQGVDDFEPIRLASWSLSKIWMFAMWFFYTFIILSTIQSQLPVMFAFDNPKELPFHDVKSLLESNFTVYGTPTAVEMLNSSLTSHHSELAKKVQPLPSAPSGTNRYELYAALAKKKKCALLINQETLLEISFRSCDLFIAIDNLIVARVAALLLARNSPMREQFEQGYAKVSQQGISQSAYQDYEIYMRTSSLVRTHGSCFRQKVVTEPSVRARALHLSNFLFVLWFLLGSLGLSFVCLLFETAWSRLY